MKFALFWKGSGNGEVLHHLICQLSLPALQAILTKFTSLSCMCFRSEVDSNIFDISELVSMFRRRRPREDSFVQDHSRKRQKGAVCKPDH